MLGICVIWIITSAINDVDGILRKDLNTSTILRGDMDHCKRRNEDKYSCWIGKPILSRDNEFYKILTKTATSSTGTLENCGNSEKIVVAPNLI